VTGKVSTEERGTAMERTQEQVIQDQVVEKAKYAASFAAASGNVVKGAFLSTVNGATTTGEREGRRVLFGDN
jgi:hypothetical protein